MPTFYNQELTSPGGIGQAQDSNIQYQLLMEEHNISFTASHWPAATAHYLSWEPQIILNPIFDITIWQQAYTRLMVALVSVETSKKEESVGVVAHLHLSLQLHEDLASSQWLCCDQEYREWAAIRGAKIRGGLNLAIYGCCLSYQQLSQPLKETVQRYIRHSIVTPMDTDVTEPRRQAELCTVYSKGYMAVI